MSKSYQDADPVTQYVAKIAVKADPLEQELTEKSLQTGRMATMLGAPEVLQLGKNLIQLIQAKRVLDIGTFTGSSALAFSLALPPDGFVISMDVNHEALIKIGLPVIERRADLRAKIDFRLGAALDTLDGLLQEGQAGTFDFVFIDADKGNYSNYYERSLQLLRSGGVIMALWGRSTHDPRDPAGVAINALNQRIADDPRVNNSLLFLGDGVHLAFKK